MQIISYLLVKRCFANSLILEQMMDNLNRSCHRIVFTDSHLTANLNRSLNGSATFGMFFICNKYLKRYAFNAPLIVLRESHHN
mgnify:CR=1 FL=1